MKYELFVELKSTSFWGNVAMKELNIFLANFGGRGLKMKDVKKILLEMKEQINLYSVSQASVR